MAGASDTQSDGRPGASVAPPPRQPLQRSSSGKDPRASMSMSGPLYMQASGNVVIVRRIKRKNESPIRQFTRWFVDNQTGVAFNLFALLFLAHSFFPRLRSHTTNFFTLSYYNPKTGLYNIGKNDAYLIVFYIVLLTGLRAASMEYILAPFAKYFGLSKRKAITRFSEQGWMLAYYTVICPLGMYLYWNSPYAFNLENIWSEWPKREFGGLLKGFLLAELSFYLQQIMVINIEERRKDHWQMLTHHFVTVSLIGASYVLRFSRVANVILVLMDLSDFFLPLAKCLKYLGYTTICDIMFGCFMLGWFVSRHIFYVMVCYSVWRHTATVMPEGCFRAGADSAVSVPIGPGYVSVLTAPIKSLTPLSLEASNKLGTWLEGFVDSRGAICFNNTVRWAFLSLLLFLELLIAVWFVMIVQVAIRVVKGDGADDTRSDDEAEEDEEDEEFIYEEAQAVEEEVGVEELDFKGWERRSGLKRPVSTSSGVSLPGHSDRKELLGRIGCEKQVD